MGKASSKSGSTPSGVSKSQETGYAVLIGGVRLPLCERSIVGRAPESDVCIAADRRVSRRHARLTVCAHGIVIEDLGSKGGVFVDGQRIHDGRLLVGGERIRVGHTEVALLHAAAEGEPAKLDFEEKTMIPESRAVAQSGYFRAVDALPHQLEERDRASNAE